MTEQEKVQFLIDRVEVSELVHRYPIAVDSRNWNLFRSIFTDEIEVDLRGPGDKPNMKATNADKFTQRCKRAISMFAVTQHVLTDYTIEVKGEEAMCLCYMQARHINPDGKGTQAIWDIGGYYTFNLIRKTDGWKVYKYTLVLTWETNRPTEFKI